MDYETKILLHRLVEEVEKLNSPDWWIIGITVVNALIMAWLGWRQYKLQKQQTKAQEYEIYRKLYRSIKSFNEIIDSFVFDLWYIIWPPTYHETDIDKLKKRQEKILSLYDDLENNIIDFELKFSTGFLEKKKYYAILETMYNMLNDFIYLYNKNDDYWFCRKKKEEYVTEAETACRNKNDEALIKIILEHIPEIGHKKCSKLGFEIFMNLKSEICSDSIIEEIMGRCKVD